MSQDRQLIELENIGEKIAKRLNSVGIFSEEALRRIGSVAAYKILRKKFPGEILPICYYLYSFEGALCDVHWNDIGDESKYALNIGIS